MRVAFCLSIDQEELLGGHSSVEASGRKGRGSDDESSGAQLPKSKVSVRKEVDSKEHHSAIEADLPIAKEGCRGKATDSRAMGLASPWYHRGGTFMESLIPCSHRGRALVIKGAEEVENAKANSKYQDKVGRAEAKELHKTGVDGLLIKRAKSDGLWVDARVLDQGTK
ncbi:hypothetical protein BHM03_00023535 [Ensete ventricosum]|nr:hypothetical protein BHM03_00023535 [Ensete ventricosum]